MRLRLSETVRLKSFLRARDSRLGKRKRNSEKARVAKKKYWTAVNFVYSCAKYVLLKGSFIVELVSNVVEGLIDEEGKS